MLKLLNLMNPNQVKREKSYTKQLWRIVNKNLVKNMKLHNGDYSQTVQYWQSQK